MMNIWTGVYFSWGGGWGVAGPWIHEPIAVAEELAILCGISVLLLEVFVLRIHAHESSKEVQCLLSICSTAHCHLCACC